MPCVHREVAVSDWACKSSDGMTHAVLSSTTWGAADTKCGRHYFWAYKAKEARKEGFVEPTTESVRCIECLEASWDP